MVIDENLSRSRRVDPGDEVGEGGLAATAAAVERQVFPAGNIERRDTQLKGRVWVAEFELADLDQIWTMAAARVRFKFGSGLPC